MNTLASTALPKINGVALLAEGESISPEALRDLAYAELLRQEARRLGILKSQPVRFAQLPTETEQSIIESMLETQVVTPSPTPEERKRYYEANKKKYVVDQSLNIRHILFAVTLGVPVQALARHAEEALLGLMDKSKMSDFEKKAQELSNCPSGKNGGHLGWITPHECSPELAQTLFFDGEAQFGDGLHSRLIHSRHGLHIIDVLDRRPGRQLSFDEVEDRIDMQLSMQSRATALRQYMMLLVGAAELEGIELEGADTPLVQN